MDDIEDEFSIAHDVPEDETTNRERIKAPVVHYYKDDKGVRTTTSFLKSYRRCLKRIRDAMLLHNWQEAAVYYNSYIQSLEALDAYTVNTTVCEITWRLGTEILRHLPNASAEDFNAVYEQLKHNGVKNFSKICLEHCFHLMLSGEIEEAKRQLSIGESWRYGNFSIAQGNTKKIIHAYSGFLDYLTWFKKKSSAVENDEVSSNHEMHTYFRQASVTLKDIITQPGVWDPFVLSYINMLEFYDDEEGALQILENYAYNKEFPNNPNAHVYLYQFLKRHDAPPDKLIGSLRILRTLVPSHELMLELCSLLLCTKFMSDLEEALTISMDLLEFSSWKSDIRAWSCLLNIMKILRRKKCIETVKKEWDARYSLWFSLHYRSYIGRKDMAENASIMKVKREVLRVVHIYSSHYTRYASKIERKSGSKKKECTVREMRKKMKEKKKKMMEEKAKMEEMKKQEKEKKKQEKEKKKQEKEKKKQEKEKKKQEKEKKEMEKMKKKKKMEKLKKKMEEKMELEKKRLKREKKKIIKMATIKKKMFEDED
ncbi:TATA box-binding protein-associated factor RNA polymerase I subunit A-like [Pseudorasbora parva]|uniref:TATA box-binding protein-associated factor RNA polymerase I subunit A-like n=1 Tax=Pseudorasbora parva TaxID=51549 RepID=UPI00351F1AEF